jgi:hypothetical protein
MLYLLFHIKEMGKKNIIYKYLKQNKNSQHSKV